MKTFFNKNQKAHSYQYLKTFFSTLTTVIAAVAITGCGSDSTVIIEGGSSSSSSGVSSASSGWVSSSSSSTGNASNSSGFPQFGFTNTVITDNLTNTIDDYRGINRLDVENTVVSVDATEALSLIQNGFRQSLYQQTYKRYLLPTENSSSSGSASTSTSSSGIPVYRDFETIAEPGTFNVASVGSAPTSSRLNEVIKDDYWLISDVTEGGKKLNFEIFELDSKTGKIEQKLDYKSIAERSYTFTSAMGFDFVNNSSDGFEKLVLITEQSKPGEQRRPKNTEISAHLINIKDFKTPDDKNTLTFSGNVLAQHRVKDTLFVFSQYRIEMDGLQSNGPNLSDAIAANENLISNSTLNQLLKSQQENNTFFSHTNRNYKSVSSLLKVTAVDLLSEKITGNTFFAMPVDGLFLENDFLYTWASPKLTSISTTSLAKYQFTDEGLKLNATGKVDGIVTIENDSALKGLNVNNGVIRLISTNATQQHHVIILADNLNGKLEVIGSLPNSQIETISTNHLVFNASFSDTKVVLNTKQQTNFKYALHGTAGPSYVINLADNNPEVIGEFRTGDFANYTEFLGSDHFITVQRSGAWLYDTKISLWNSHNPSTPIVSKSFSAPAGSISSGGPIASSPGNMSQTGVSVEKVDNSIYRVIIPIDFTGLKDGKVYTNSELVFIEVSGLPDNPVMTTLGKAIAHQRFCNGAFNGGYGCVYDYIYTGRKTHQIDDSVFYLYGGSRFNGGSGISSFLWPDFENVIENIVIE